MKQRLYEKHETDAMGGPAGGRTSGIGIDLTWQDGPVGTDLVRNGASVEAVIQAAIGRLRFLQKAQSCREYAVALTNLETGLLWLQSKASAGEAGGQ